MGGVVVLLAALSGAASAAIAILPAPGAPDPKQMVLTSADLGGARVTLQRYYKDPDFPSVISYEREFEDGRIGSTPITYLYNEAEVGTSVTTTTRYLANLRRLFGTKQFRAFLVESFATEFPVGGLVSNLQIGRPRDLGAGAGSFDVPLTMRTFGLRTEMHIAAFRVERVLGVVTAVGEPGRRLALPTMTRLAKIVAGRMSAELAPRNVAPPTIAGAPIVGQSLSATAGTWTRSPSAFTYQWQRCDVAGANCASIAGATGETYTVAELDVGATLRVGVSVRNTAGVASAVSAPTSVVAAAGVPANTSAPTISGAAQVGQLLTAGTGSWNGAPTSFAFQWLRCNAGGGSCTDIVGATSGTYVPVAADLGTTIRVVVTATNGSGSVSADSEATAVVT
jgi:hypothetical protein